MSEKKHPDRRHEPQSFAQRVQTVTVVIGALCAAWAAYQSQRTYELTVRQEQAREVQAAIDQSRAGAPEGAVQLGRSAGPVALLVVGINARGPATNGWADKTRAALAEIDRRRAELTPADKASLREKLDENGRVIDLFFAENRDLGSRTDILTDYVCVQLALQRVTGARPAGWPQMRQRIVQRLGGVPNC